MCSLSGISASGFSSLTDFLSCFLRLGVLGPQLDLLLLHCRISYEVLLVQQGWPLQCVSHPVLMFLPVHHVLNFITNSGITIKHILPPSELKLGNQNIVNCCLRYLLKQRQGIFTRELRRIYMYVTILGVIVQVDFQL